MITNNPAALVKYHFTENYYFRQSPDKHEGLHKKRVNVLTDDKHNHVKVYGNLSSDLGYNNGDAISEIDMSNLLSGRNNASEKIARTHKVKGVDLTFSPPKSISIAALVYKDNRIIDLHDEAVLETMGEIEKYYAFGRPNNKQKVYTGKMCYVVVRDGFNRDHEPHLHSHVVMLNITKTGNKYTGLDLKKVLQKNFNKAFGSLYRTHLAAKLKQIGYGLEFNNDMRITNIPKELEEKFSQRRKSIVEAKSAGMQDLEAWDTTRKDKTPGIDKPDIVKHWNTVAKGYEFVLPQPTKVSKPGTKVNEKELIDNFRKNHKDTNVLSLLKLYLDNRMESGMWEDICYKDFVRAVRTKHTKPGVPGMLDEFDDIRDRIKAEQKKRGKFNHNTDALAANTNFVFDIWKLRDDKIIALCINYLFCNYTPDVLTRFSNKKDVEYMINKFDSIKYNNLSAKENTDTYEGAYKILICGGREFKDEEPIKKLIYSLPVNAVVIHGGARGADSIADKHAQERGLKVIRVFADWAKHGRKAGPFRNKQMVEMTPDIVYAFYTNTPYTSRGTVNTVTYAKKANLNVVEYYKNEYHYNNQPTFTFFDKDAKLYSGHSLSSPAIISDVMKAKSGDSTSINTVINNYITKDFIDSFKTDLAGYKPGCVLVPLTEKGYGTNILPIQFAAKLAGLTGVKTDDQLVYKPSPLKRKELNSWERMVVHRDYGLANPEALKNKNVVLVDDQFTTGGCLRDAYLTFHKHNITCKSIVCLGSSWSKQFLANDADIQAIKARFTATELKEIETLIGIKPEHLTNAEASLILRTGTQNVLLKLNQAKESVNTMLKASAAEQSSIVQSPPTGELTAYQNPTIKLNEVKNLQVNTLMIHQHSQAADIMKFIKDSDREKLLVMSLDDNNKLLGTEVVSIGTVTENLIHPREMLKTPIYLNAKNIIIVHNHPSGDPTPSEDDIRVTAKLANSCKNVGINLIDHIVIGDMSYATITPNVTGYQTFKYGDFDGPANKYNVPVYEVTKPQVESENSIRTPADAAILAKKYFSTDKNSYVVFYLNVKNKVNSCEVYDKSIKEFNTMDILRKSILYNSSGVVVCTNEHFIDEQFSKKVSTDFMKMSIELLDIISVDTKNNTSFSYKESGFILSDKVYEQSAEEELKVYNEHLLRIYKSDKKETEKLKKEMDAITQKLNLRADLTYEQKQKMCEVFNHKNSLSLWDTKLSIDHKLSCAECYIIPDKKTDILSQFDKDQRGKIDKTVTNLTKSLGVNVLDLGFDR